jgi:hypothetical protein
MSNRDADLVLHLKLDDIDIAANTVPDSSPLQKRALVHGADLVADDNFGACVNFDQPDDFVEVSDIALTGVNPAHTIEAWIKLEAYPQARSWILLLGQEGAGSHHWLVNAEGAPDPLSKKAQLGVWGELAMQAMPAMPLAEWVHVATAYDGRDVVFYVNGEPTDTPRSATFNLTNRRLTLARRGISSERNFQGKIANVRIYKRALSKAEIREDMNADKLALPAFRKAHPIAFSLSDENENYVLYISDDPRDENRLNLELRNTSVGIIKLEDVSGNEASRENHHFELVFRNGVLSDKTLKKLSEKKGEIVNTEEWDVSSSGEDSQSGVVSLYFLCKKAGRRLRPAERLTIPLRGVSAAAGSGARGTRIELKLNQISYADDTTPITGSRIQHVQIMSHLGSRRAPLHVGFVGSNRILNDGSSANTLVLQLMNVPKSEQDDSVTLTRDSEFLVSFDVESDDEVAPWSLCTQGEIEQLKANDDSIIVAKVDANGDVVVDDKGNPVSDAGRWEVGKTDRGQGESPVWKISPQQNMVLQRDDYIQIQISNIKTSLPSGLTNLYLEYKKIAGYWDGQVVCTIEKAPLMFCDAKDQQGKYTGELRVGIGAVNPGAKLEIAMAPKDANTKPLVIRRDSAHYLTVLHDGKVGIGKALPKASLDVNGDIRANFFRAGEGHSRRLPVGKRPVGTGPDLSAIVWDEDIKWYRIAKVASPGFALAGATFSVRASIAGKTSQVLVCQLISSTRRLLRKGPFARFTVLSNTGSLVFRKARIVIDEQDATALEVFTRWSFEGETDVSFSIYDNLDSPPWQPVAWEERPADIPGTAAACEYDLNHQFLVADAAERLSVDPRGDLLINGKVGLGTTTPVAKLSIRGGLHVGGDSDPGDKNVLVDGALAVTEESTLTGPLTVKSTLRLQHGDNQDHAAAIAVEPDKQSDHPLIFKTFSFGKWSNRVAIYPNGDVVIGEDLGLTPESRIPIIASLTVAGNISEKLDLIEVKGRGDWTAQDHPVMKYFSKRLTGKPVGTMLRAITDHRDWRGHYWQGWVDADRNIRVIHNSINTSHVAPKSTD